MEGMHFDVVMSLSLKRMQVSILRACQMWSRDIRLVLCARTVARIVRMATAILPSPIEREMISEVETK